MKKIIYLPILLVALYFNPVQCQTITGWPVGGDTNLPRILSSPICTDIDDDSKEEIIIIGHGGNLCTYDEYGGLQGMVTAPFTKGIVSSIAYGNVDDDNQKEIVIVGYTTINSTDGVYVQLFGPSGRKYYYQILYTNISTNLRVKGTPCLINCKKYSGMTLHDAMEILLRDGDGRIHMLTWGGSAFSEATTEFPQSTLSTGCDVVAYKDWYGSQIINSSVAAASVSNTETVFAVGSTDGKVYWWKVSSTASNNMSIIASRQYTPSDASTTKVRFYSSPALADLNSDGCLDIVIGGTDGKVYAWNGSNTDLLPGWPKSTSESKAVLVSPLVAEIDNNISNGLEVVAGCDGGDIYAWHANGDALGGNWPVALGGAVFASPIAAELDRNNPGLEIVAASLSGRMTILKMNGSPLNKRWPKELRTPIYATPVAVDLHKTSHPAVIVGGYDGRLYVFDLSSWLPEIVPTHQWTQFRGGPERLGVVP
jgi:hypothetical protein